MDLAATSFYKDNNYKLTKTGRNFAKEEYMSYLVNLAKKYNLFSLEDSLHEDDWDGWSSLTQQLGEEIIIIGDDLLVTNKRRLQEAIAKKACNGIIIKLNQIGTVSETIDAVRLAQSYGWKIMVSHRSGETLDNFIADLSVGVGADFIKSGAYTKDVRIVKYDRLLEIENELHATK